MRLAIIIVVLVMSGCTHHRHSHRRPITVPEIDKYIDGQCYPPEERCWERHT